MITTNTTVEERDMGGFQDGPSTVISVRVTEMSEMTGNSSSRIMAGWVEVWPADDEDNIDGKDVFASFTNSGELYNTHPTKEEALVVLTAALTADAFARL